MTLIGKGGSDFFVANATAGEMEYPVTHFRSSREFGDGVDLQLDFEAAHSAAAPDDPDKSDVVFAAIEHDLVDKTPQQRFALGIRSV